MPGPELQLRLSRLRAFVGRADRFRFLSEPRAGVYLCVLLCLAERRRAHEVEVAHDDLLAEAGALVEAQTGAPYDAAQLRQDVETLRRWGNLTERVEVGRIRSLADRGRSKLLFRLDPETAHLLGWLEARTEPEALGLRDQGANHLTDIHGMLLEAGRSLAEAGRAEAGSETRRAALLRGAHLLHEADRRTDRIADELVAIGDRIARFMAEPFEVREIAELGGWLERYVDRYLEALHARRRRIRKALSLLLRDEARLLWAEAAALEREALAASPLAGAGTFRLLAPSDLLGALSTFFSAGEGLEALCRRVNARTREVTRRIQRHVEAVRLRNVRTQAIRARAHELFTTPPSADVEARAFVEALVAPVHPMGDARGGTPGAKAAPPRPARRHETTRPAFRGGRLEGKRSEPGGARALELRRLSALSDFVERAVLRGRASSSLHLAEIDDVLGARRIVQAALAFFLRGGRARPHLGNALDAAEPGRRARLEGETFVLDVPDHAVRRRRPT